MNNYFDKLFDNNKAIILEIEKIIIKHLSEHRLPNSAFNDDFYILTDELTNKINEKEKIFTFKDSFENMRFLMSVCLKNDVNYENFKNYKNDEIFFDKLSYSIDYYRKTIELSLISFVNKDITFSISNNSIYTNKFINRIKYNKIIHNNLYAVGKNFFNINEDISDRLIDIGEELNILNLISKLYTTDSEITKKFLFSNVDLSESFIEMLPLCYDFSIKEKLDDIKKYQINIENFKFDFEIKNKKQPIIKLI